MRRKKTIRTPVKKPGVPRTDEGTSRSTEACSPELLESGPDFDQEMKLRDSTPDPEPREDSSPSPGPRSCASGPSNEAGGPKRGRPTRMKLLPFTGRPQRMKLIPTARVVPLMRPMESDSSSSIEFDEPNSSDVAHGVNPEPNTQSSVGPQSSPSPTPSAAGPSRIRSRPIVRAGTRRALQRAVPRTRVLLTPERYTPPGLPAGRVLQKPEKKSIFGSAARNRRLTKRNIRTRASLRRRQKRLKPDSSPSDTTTSSYDIADDSSEENYDLSPDDQPKNMANASN